MCAECSMFHVCGMLCFINTGEWKIDLVYVYQFFYRSLPALSTSLCVDKYIMFKIIPISLLVFELKKRSARLKRLERL